VDPQCSTRSSPNNSYNLHCNHAQWANSTTAEGRATLAQYIDPAQLESSLGGVSEEGYDVKRYLAECPLRSASIASAKQHAVLVLSYHGHTEHTSCEALATRLLRGELDHVAHSVTLRMVSPATRDDGSSKAGGGLSRRGGSAPASARDVDTHRDSMTGRALSIVRGHCLNDALCPPFTSHGASICPSGLSIRAVELRELVDLEAIVDAERDETEVQADREELTAVLYEGFGIKC
jgi:hypothetical protein